MDGISNFILDIVVVLVLLISAISAFARGFTREMLAAVPWVIGFLAAVYGAPFARPLSMQVVPSQPYTDIFAGLIIFLVVFAIGQFSVRRLWRRPRNGAFNFFDRTVGFIFGVLRGAVLIALAYLVVEALLPPKEQPEWVRGSRVMPAVEAGAQFIAVLLPKEYVPQNLINGGDEADPESDMRKIIEPKPSSGKDAGDEKGYKEDTRKGLEDLIESTK